MRPSLVLVGGGGHALACIDVVEQNAAFAIAGLVDPALPKDSLQGGYPVLGSDDDLPRLRERHRFALVSVGHIRSAAPRARLYEKLAALDFVLPVIISPLAYVSPRAAVGCGSLVMHRAIVNAGAQVGENCIINTGAVVEHGCHIGNTCHVAVGAMICGDVCLEDGAFVGSGAVCRQGVTIGKGAVVGCGVTVLEDVPPDTIHTGRHR